ncbi:fimbria/pilus periplasmic chaperone [Candidatus Sororendozoicomonas aggregata]|uniref:fimbria/pilus periplasmic chaperone n=1 Tax=Candidatus Sororendozoicomonas aggregata TaxID=3073239 RepID=UPI002ED42EA2
MFRRLSALTLLLSLLFSASASAALSLDRMIVYFDPNKQPRQDVVVSNPGEETLYLQTEVFEVHNPGSKNEERVKVTDPEKLKLLTTPNKAIIPANGRKTVRMVSLEKPTGNELVYRVTFKPVVGDLEASETAVKLLIAYQALVFIRPDNPEYEVTAQQKGEQLIFKNSGNINVVLRNGRYCTTQKNDSCKPLDATTRLYADQSWKLDVPTEAVRVTYGLFDGTFERTREFTLKPLASATKS